MIPHSSPERTLSQPFSLLTKFVKYPYSVALGGKYNLIAYMLLELIV